MDWASSEWKQELTPLAIQKVNALEVKVEKLQKERQQKQLQCECLELALEKEKRKLENEKQQTIQVQRELQSLADVCKDFENKQQKLQNEIQNRDSRIGSLEALLSQTKKDNCRLQQLEINLRDLRSLRETSFTEKEQKIQSIAVEQNNSQEQNLGIALTESSGISILAEKENNKNILNGNDINRSLKEKISEQEKIIEDLKTQLNSFSNKEGVKEPINTPFKTPSGSKSKAVEASPAVRSRSNFNVWDMFGSTPAKENKETVLRHASDSSAFDVADEKFLAQQTRLKQLIQELDCQRHNFEATKNSMEQKFKEKEITLKAELKHQLQVNAELDKELKDMRNKHQQESTQTTKKLDMLTVQLKKVEETKETLEREMKNMDSKMNVSNLSLKSKEEEIQDLQKQKKIAETTLHSLQAKVLECERKCKILQEENSVLNENIKTVQLQLEGSCNLVQEKDKCLSHIENELGRISVSHENLQDKILEFENKSNNDQKRIDELLENEATWNGVIEQLEKEQIQMFDNLTFEIKKYEDLESKNKELLQYISLQKKELSEKEVNLSELKNHIIASKNEYEEKIIELNKTVQSMQEKCSVLENHVEEYSSRENFIKEQLALVEKHRLELADKLGIETSKTQDLETSIAEGKKTICLLEKELSDKSIKHNELSIQLKTYKDEHEAQIQELEGKISITLVQMKDLEKRLQLISSNEAELKDKLELLDKEKKELHQTLIDETNKAQDLFINNEELRNNILHLQGELSCKSSEFEELNQTMEAAIKEFEKKLDDSSIKEKSLVEEINMLEQERTMLKEKLDAANGEIQRLEINSEELRLSMQNLNDKLRHETSELEKVQNQILTSKAEHEVSMQELVNSLSNLQTEKTTLESELKDQLSKEAAMEEKLKLAEEQNIELNESIKSEISKTQSLQFSIDEMTARLYLLEEELSVKSAQLNELDNQMAVSKSEYERKIQDLQSSLTSDQVKYAALENRLQEYQLKEALLRQRIQVLENGIDSLSENLEAANNEIKKLESSVDEQKEANLFTSKELADKCLEIEQVTTSKCEYKNKLKEMQSKLLESSSEESSIKDKVELLEKERHDFFIQLDDQTHKIQDLESNIKELKQHISSLENSVSLKSIEYDELSEQLAASKESYKVKIEDLEKDREEIEISLLGEVNKRTLLESNVEELNRSNKLLEKELSDRSLDFEKLQCDINAMKEEYEVKVEDLKLKLSSAESKHAALLNEMNESSLNEMSFKQKLQLLETEKEELVHQIIDVTNKNVTLESNMQKLDVSLQELTSKLFVALEENDVIQGQLQASRDNEITLIIKMDLLEVENQEISACLNDEICKRQNLELNVGNLKQFVLSLEEDLSHMSEECKNIDSEIMIYRNSYETIIQDLESKLSSSETQFLALELQHEKCSMLENELKEKLILVEAEENEMADLLAEENNKVIILDEANKKLSTDITLLQEELSTKLLELKRLEEIDENIADYKHQVKELEDKLATSLTEIKGLEKLIQLVSSNETKLKHQLELFDKEKEELTQCLAEKDSKIQNLLTSNKELKDSTLYLQNELAFKSSEIEKINQAREATIEELKIKILVLEEKLSTEQNQSSSLLKELNAISVEKQSLVGEIEMLEKERCSLIDKLDVANNEIQRLEINYENLKLSMQNLDEKLRCKTLELVEFEKSKVEYEGTVQNLESKLCLTEQQLSEVQSQFQEIALKETHLKELLQVSEKENCGLSDDLKVSLQETFKLELDIEESKKLGACFEEKLALQLLKEDELVKQFETMKKEYLLTVQKLQDEISAAKIENELLKSKVKECLVNEELWGKRLESVEKEKQSLDKQLGLEANKINILESGVGELKKVILTLQVLLISNNADNRWVNNEMATSKDSCELQNLIPCGSVPLNNRNYSVSTNYPEKASNPIFYFPELELLSSLQDKDFSEALYKVFVLSLNEICYLESDLLDKLETCKFLCKYQLVEHAELDEMWKIFLCLRRKLMQIQLLKKFMFCFCGILKSNLVAHILHGASKVVLVKLFPKNFYFTMQDFLYLCGNIFNKILFSVSQTFGRNSSMNKYSVFFGKHSNIHTSDLHLPAIQKASCIIHLNKFTKVQYTFKPSHVFETKLGVLPFQEEINVEKAIQDLNIQEIPFFLNFTMTLIEWIQNACNSTSSAPGGCSSTDFSMSSLELKNCLSVLSPSSPMFRIFRKYCSDILDIENNILDEICYWKHHCSILGLNKCDIQKIIDLFELKQKKEETFKKPIPSKNKPHDEEILTVRKVNESLEQSLKIEREKQKLLNATIEEIEQDLADTFLQKEKFKNMALATSKMLAFLKKFNVETDALPAVQLSSENFSDVCFCETCVMEDEADECYSHDVLKLQDCFGWIDRLTETRRQHESTVSELKLHDSELKALYKELQDKNSELEMTVDRYNENFQKVKTEVESLKYELKQQRESSKHFREITDNKDTLVLELEAKNSELSKLIDDYKNKLNVCEEKINLLSSDQKRLELLLLCKGNEIVSLQALIDEKNSICEKSCLNCEEYKNRIHLLNSTIAKFEEEKAINNLSNLNRSQNLDNTIELDFVDGKPSKAIINELQSRIDSLKKSNDSLNLTIENTEEELKNVYAEKQSVGAELKKKISEKQRIVEELKIVDAEKQNVVEELRKVYVEKQDIVEELGKLSAQLTRFKQEASMSKENYINDKKVTDDLVLKLKEYEKIKFDSDSIIEQLKCKNEKLEKDVNVLKNVQREHEEVVWKKNRDLKESSQTIELLQIRIEDLQKQLSNFKIPAEKDETSEHLKLQLKELMSLISGLEEENKRLKMIEAEKDQIIKKVTELELQKNNLAEEYNQLASELEVQQERNTGLEMKNKEFSDSLNSIIVLKSSLEEEFKKKENSIESLKEQLGAYSTELEEMKEVNSELSAEISALKASKSHLHQEMEGLNKSLEDVKNNFKIESNEKHHLLIEIDELKKLLKDQDLLDIEIMPELPKVRNALRKAIDFIIDLLNVILDTVTLYTENNDFELLKSNLVSLVLYWKRDSDNELQIDIFAPLKLFFKTLIDNHKDGFSISKLVMSIKDSVNDIKILCESSQKMEPATSPENTSNVSMFETTFTKNFSVVNDFSLCNTLADLHCIKIQIDEYLCNLKNLIYKKNEEIDVLQEKVNKLSSLKTREEKSKPSESDKASFKWKYELIKRNFQKLEGKYNSIVISSQQMENCIKNLEEEKKTTEEKMKTLEEEEKILKEKIKILEEEKNSLEEEAEELCRDLKNLEAHYASSDDLLNTFTELNTVKLKLRDLENENIWLKESLKESQLRQADVSAFERPSLKESFLKKR